MRAPLRSCLPNRALAHMGGTHELVGQDNGGGGAAGLEADGNGRSPAAAEATAR